LNLSFMGYRDLRWAAGATVARLAGGTKGAILAKSFASVEISNG
jgi:hypothetical protein